MPIDLILLIGQIKPTRCLKTPTNSLGLDSAINFFPKGQHTTKERKALASRTSSDAQDMGQKKSFGFTNILRCQRHRTSQLKPHRSDSKGK